MMMNYRVQRVGTLGAAYRRYTRDACKASSTPLPILIGKLVVVKNPQCDVCFVDSTGCIPIEFTNFNHDWIGPQLCIYEWNLVPLLRSNDPSSVNPRSTSENAIGNAYIEVLQDPFLIPDDHHLLSCRSYQFSSTTDLFDPTSPSRTRAHIEKTIQLVKKYQPETLVICQAGRTSGNISATIQQIRKRKVVNVHGRVLSKSGYLHVHAQKQAYFVVEIECYDRPPNLSAFVLFEYHDTSKHDIWRYYNSLLVGRTYLFVNLHTKQAKFGKNGDTVRKLLTFSSADSRLHLLSETALESILASFTPSQNCQPPESEPDDLQMNHGQTTNQHQIKCGLSVTISYVGKITKVIDVDGGLYELDGDHELYTTYYPMPTFGRGLREGAKIRLHNVHLLVREDLEKKGLYQKTKKRAVFVACLHSSLEIVSFSSTNGTCILVDTNKRIQILKKWTGLNIADVITLNDLKVRIESVMGGSVSANPNVEYDSRWCLDAAKKILRRLGFNEYTESISRLSTALNHKEECQIALLRYPKPLIFTIEEIYIRLLRFFVINDQPMAGRQGGYWFRIFRQEDLELTDGIVLGFLGADEAGNLKLSDSSASIPVAVQDVDGSAALERIHCEWALLKYQIVVEFWGGSRDFAENKLKRIYIRTTFKDFCSISKIPPSVTEAEYNLIEIDECRTIAFVLHHQGPVTARFGADNDDIKTIGYLQGIVWILKEYVNSLASIESYKLLSGPHFSIGEFHDVSRWPTFRTGQMYLMHNVYLTEYDNGGQLHVSFLATRATTFQKAAVLHGDIFEAEESQSRPIYDGLRVIHVSSHQPFSVAVPEGDKVLSVSQLIELVEEAPDVVESLISVEGVIASKETRSVSDPWPFHQRLDAINLLTRWNIGVGDFTQLLIIRLRDSTDMSQTLDVYMDIRQYSFPLAMLPGARVRLEHLAVTVSKRGSIYLTSGPETNVRILHNVDEFEQKDAALDISEQILAGNYSCWKLIDFFKIREGRATLHIATCTIMHIYEVHFWRECTTCFVRLLGDGTCPSCPATSQQGRSVGRTNAKAKFTIEDGTLEATMNLEGFLPVTKLLNIKDHQVKRLDELVQLTSTEITYRKEQPWAWRVENEFDGAGEYELAEEVGRGLPPNHAAAIGIIESAAEDESVKRQCQILCRPFTFASNKKDESKGDLKEVDGEWNPEMVLSVDDARTRSLRLTDRSSMVTFGFQTLNLHGVWLENIDAQAELRRVLLEE
ncbi:CST complex subunit ctc1 [Chytridiales sp. JEL 0842]|nr:CST complex subunit ctc1 [Chytridiales sp. JEL 0842]